jgi:FkbM family methyltransferase
MSIFRGATSYYSLLGTYGVALVTKARLLRQPTQVLVSVRGFKSPVAVRLRTTDVSLLSEVLGSAEFDLDFPVPPQVILDAGANIGLTSVYYANKYPEARVLAIEPELSNYELLRKNTASYPNIVCIHAALWKRNARITLADPGLGHWGFQTAEKLSSSPLTEVEGITIDSLMERFGIDYIDLFRVDIEGAEQEVFANSAPWIRKVGVIAVELHDRLKVGCSRSVYLATKDFQWEIRRGETVFLGRDKFVPQEVLHRAESADFANASLRGVRGKRRCAIISVT